MSSLGERYLETAKHALIFGLGNLSNRIIGFLLIPLYTTFLSPADYGLLALINTISALLNILLQMGVSSSIFKHYFSVDEIPKRKAIISTALFWLGGAGILFSFTFHHLAPSLSKLVFDTNEYSLHLRLMSSTVVFSMLQVIPFAYFRAEKKSLQYVIFSILNFSVGVGLNIYLVAVAKQGILGVLVAGLISSALFASIGLLLCRKSIAPSFSLDSLRSLLQFGLPLVPAAIGSYILVRSDRFFLEHFSSLADVGLYSMAYNFGLIINMILVQPFQLIWLPTAFEIKEQSSAKRFFAGMLTYFFLIASWVALGLSLLGEEVVTLVTAAPYHDSHKFIPWIAYSYVAYGAYMVVNIGIYLKNKTKYSIGIVGIAATINLFLNWFLISQFGSLGAAWSTLLSYILLFSCAWLINRRIYPLQYEWTRLLKITLVTIFLLIAGQLATKNIIIAIIYKSSLVLGYWVLLLASRFFKTSELQTAKSMTRGLPNSLRGYIKKSE